MIGPPSEGPITQARPLAFVFPQYPDEERKKGVRGKVRISLEVNEKGKVIDAVVIENLTGSKLCAQAALKAARATRFSPARNKYGPITSWLVLSYDMDDRK